MDSPPRKENPTFPPNQPLFYSQFEINSFKSHQRYSLVFQISHIPPQISSLHMFPNPGLTSLARRHGAYYPQCLCEAGALFGWGEKCSCCSTLLHNNIPDKCCLYRSIANQYFSGESLTTNPSVVINYCAQLCQLHWECHLERSGVPGLICMSCSGGISSTAALGWQFLWLFHFELLGRLGTKDSDGTYLRLSEVVRLEDGDLIGEMHVGDLLMKIMHTYGIIIKDFRTVRLRENKDRGRDETMIHK